MSNPKPIKKQAATEVVEFNSKKKLSNKKKTIEENLPTSNVISNKKLASSSDKESNEYLSLKQAKFDVFKYGIKGFSKQEQENANIQLAIKLGAAVKFI